VDGCSIEALVVAAEPALAAGLRDALAGQGVRATSSPSAASAHVVSLARRTRADVVLVDLRLPDAGALALLAALRALPVAAVMFTARGAPDELRPSLERGALGCIVGPVSARRLAIAVYTAARGEPVMSPSLTRQLLRELSSSRGGADPHGITRREREVLGLLAEGRRTAEVASDLTLSKETVRGHVKSVLRKLGVRTCAAAVARLVAERQIPLGS
jgi:DNA-binding NarL/FixJ family response regulator